MSRRSLHPPLAVLAVTALVACAPPSDPAAPTVAEPAPAVDLAAAEQAIRDSSRQWQAADQARDLLTVMSFMDADVTTIFDGHLSRGRATLEESFRQRWQSQEQADVSWQTEKVVVAASGDLAYERGSWQVDAGQPGAERGEYVTVWRKVDGSWKVVVDAGSTIADEAPGAA